GRVTWAVYPLDALPHHGMLERVALQRERHQRVDPRGLDPAPRAIGLLALDDPALGPLERAPAQPRKRMALISARGAVEQREQARASGPRRRRLGCHRDAQLVEVVGQLAAGSVRFD